MQNFKSRKSLFILAFLLCSQGMLFAQAPDIEWQSCLGGSSDEEMFGIVQTADGGYVIAGAASSNNGDVFGYHGGHDDVWIVKVSSFGSLEWQKCLGGPENEYARSIIQTSDRGFVVAGVTSSTNEDVSGNHGISDAWIIKLDSVGNIQWQKCFGGDSVDYANSIIQTFDGGFAFAGHTTSREGDVSGNHGGGDAWFVKLSSSGILQWQKCLGGANNDEINSIKQSSDSGYILTGWTNSLDEVLSTHGDYDAWVVKLNDTGKILWQRCLGGSGDDRSYSIIETLDKGYALTGNTYSYDGNLSGIHILGGLWVVKLNTLGVVEWQKCIGGSSGDDYGFSIIQNSDSNYIIAGEVYSQDGDVSGRHQGYNDAWVVMLNSKGAIEWQKCIGGTKGDVAESIIQTSDGGYAFTGYTNSDDGDVSGHRGEYDAWIVKLSSLPSIVENHSLTSGHLSLSTFPNPASNIITLGYDLPKSSAVGITIYSVTGERMKEIHEVSVESGHHEAVLDLGGFPDGTYFISISACGVTERRVVEVIK